MTIARTICLGFIAIITIGTILLMMPVAGTSGTWNDPLVALFMTTSAVCVTGLAVVDPGTYFSLWGQGVLAAEVQIGGLGYMTLTTFLILLIGRKFDLKQKLAIHESFDRPFLQGSRSVIRSIIATTLVFELAGAILMYSTFAKDRGAIKGLWFSIFHSISAFNNAGFALFKDNLMSYNTSIPINLGITGLIIVGGIGYQVIIEAYVWLQNIVHRKKAKFVFSLNFLVATSTTFLLLLAGTIAFFLTEHKNPDTLAPLSFHHEILAAWFQSVTTRTAGFNSIDNGKLTTAGLFITMGLMFVGASPGGTGGGIKTTTFKILANATQAVLQGKEEVIIYERKVSVALLLKAVAVAFGSAAAVVLSTILVSLTNSHLSLIQILFEVISAFGTVGLSMGITSSLSPVGQLIIILTMYTGRVGVTLLMASILGDPRPSSVQYPQENLLVG
jgi:trk system potassium uptake protein TrkH